MEEIINSIKYYDFINKTNEILYQLLYSSENGFLGLSSENAILEAQNYIDKFDYEISKLFDNLKLE